MLNNRGALTVDFLFAMVLVGSITAILLALSFTLVAVEVGQYVAFASSRSYFSSQANENKQIELAKNKFDQLMSDTNIKKILNNSWFKVEYTGTGNFSTDYNNSGRIEDTDTIWGTRLKFTANILNINLPIFGPSGGDATNFSANLNSYIGREPNFDECYAFVKQRWQKILEKIPTARRAQSRDDKAYAVFVDNGC